MTRYIGGFHAIQAALRSSASDIDLLFVRQGRRDGRLKKLLTLAHKHAIVCQETSSTTLDSFIVDRTHQGVVARLKSEAQALRADLLDHLRNHQRRHPERSLLVLVLDGVQDPHNVGACLRSADAAGVDAVVVPVNNSPGLTATVRKVSSGAAESVAYFQVSNLQRTLIDLQALGFWIYGAAADAPSALYQLDLTDSVVLVMGSEGDGLRRLTRERCDRLFSLPMYGQVESLNVSVAAGICLYEAVRQRLG